MLQRERLARVVAVPRGTGKGGAGVLQKEKRRRPGGRSACCRTNLAPDSRGRVARRVRLRPVFWLGEPDFEVWIRKKEAGVQRRIWTPALSKRATAEPMRDVKGGAGRASLLRYRMRQGPGSGVSCVRKAACAAREMQRGRTAEGWSARADLRCSEDHVPVQVTREVDAARLCSARHHEHEGTRGSQLNAVELWSPGTETRVVSILASPRCDLHRKLTNLVSLL